MTKTEEKALELRELLDSETKEMLADIETKAMQPNLADMIRQGGRVTTQAVGWGDGESACALHRAVISAKANGYL